MSRRQQGQQQYSSQKNTLRVVRALKANPNRNDITKVACKTWPTGYSCDTDKALGQYSIAPLQKIAPLFTQSDLRKHANKVDPRWVAWFYHIFGSYTNKEIKSYLDALILTQAQMLSKADA